MPSGVRTAVQRVANGRRLPRDLRGSGGQGRYDGRGGARRAEPVDEAVRIQDEFYILATQSRADERTRVLKQGETFAVFDRFGDLPAIAATEYGLYHGGTRYLSRCDLRISGQHALLLSSTIRKAEPVL